jgi:hypothetical protein
VGKYIPALKIPLKDFFAGCWGEYLQKIFSDKADKSRIATNGAEITSHIFLDFY